MNVLERLQTRAPVRWWVGITLVVLGATIAWALRFTFGYLFTPLSCEVGVWLQYLISAGFLLIGLAVLGVNLVLLRRDLDRATRFLLSVGAGLNVFFIGVMLLETTAVMFVDPCAKGAIP